MTSTGHTGWKRVCTVVGARPQFVKAAVLGPALARVGVEEVLVHTGQHYDDRMSRIFFDELGLRPPRVNLEIGSGSHARQTGRALERFEAWLDGEGADCEAVVVFGDTNSTLAATLAAAKLGRPVVHVEAGLRSHNRRMPEEINRVVTDRLAEMLACPSESAVELLAREGRTEGVWFTGDVMFDAVRLFSHAAGDPVSETHSDGYHLLTAHRPETVDSEANLRRLLDLVRAIDRRVVWPLHPRARARLAEFGLAPPSNVEVIEPVGYRRMLRLIRGADRVLTDSGGLQKEAFWLERPCVTLRSETEWTETCVDGWNTVVGLDVERALAALDRTPSAPPRPVYGDGFAADRIARLIAGLPIEPPRCA